jgi:hypothetical protein
MTSRRLIPLLTVILLLAPSLHAQAPDNALSDSEIETLRNTAYVANDRVLAFVGFLDQRTASIQQIAAKPRRPGTEQDIHDLLEQFTAIVDELNDNLDDYGPRHRDIRKSLPKVLAAAERWGTVLRTPPDNDAYNVSRKLALEALRDLREAAAELLDQQKAWFKDHPPPKVDPASPIEEQRPH